MTKQRHRQQSRLNGESVIYGFLVPSGAPTKEWKVRHVVKDLDHFLTPCAQDYEEPEEIVSREPRVPGYDPTPLILILVLGSFVLGCMYLFYDYYQKAGSPLIDRPKRKIGERLDIMSACRSNVLIRALIDPFSCPLRRSGDLLTEFRFEMQGPRNLSERI